MATLEAGARGLTVTEILSLHQLPDDGLRFEEALDPAWVDQQLGISQGAAPFYCEPGAKVRLDVQPMGAMAARPPVLLRGNAEAALRSTCVRCLADVRVSLSVAIEQMLFPRSGDAEEAAAATLEELDEGAYSNEGIDLPNVLREAILLELAMNPTCEDEAACDQRTKQLIDDVNAKNRPSIDPRWAALVEMVKKPS